MISKEQKQKIDHLIESMKSGHQRAIGRLISLVENDIEIAADVIKKIYPITGNAYIIGITGAPGSGKSSLINSMTEDFVNQGKKVGIVAVDPTSPFSGGAILGDRIRMKSKFQLEDVFIRSMANRGQLGGLARATKDVVKILDAAGYDIILIETVGVGQSEVEIFKSAHTTVVIVIPGLGDEIQAIKAGIMEITDIFVVNKMDLDGADRKVAEINSMLDLNENHDVMSETHSIKIVQSLDWRPPVIKTNAITKENLDKFIQLILDHKKFLIEKNQMNNRLDMKYKCEVLDILKYRLTKNIEDLIYENPKVQEYIQKILTKERDPYSISEEILLKFVHMGEKG